MRHGKQLTKMEIDLLPYVLEDRRKGTKIELHNTWRNDFKKIVARTNLTARVHIAQDLESRAIEIAIFKNNGKDIGYVRGDESGHYLRTHKELMAKLKPM